jgi:hypothetical protein
MVTGKLRRVKRVIDNRCVCGEYVIFLAATQIEQESDMWYTGPSKWTRYWQCPVCGTIYAEEWLDNDVISFNEYKRHTAEKIKELAPRASGYLC